MPHAGEYEKDDKAALEDALLAMRICPRCREDLRPVSMLDRVFGCYGRGVIAHSPETWHLPGEGTEEFCDNTFNGQACMYRKGHEIPCRYEHGGE